MNMAKKYKKQIVLIVCIVAVTLLILTVYHSIKAFNVVLHQNFELIGDAGFMLLDKVSDDMEQEEYDEAMLYYWSTVTDAVQSINGISENLWLYKNYSLEKFEDYLLSQVVKGQSDMKIRKQQLEIISKVQEQIEQTENAGIEYDLFSNKETSAAYYFKQIESIFAD